MTEPQWRFETKLPPLIEVDEHDTIEMECTVQDEDAECEWSFAGEVGNSFAQHRPRESNFAHLRKSMSIKIPANTRSSRVANFVN